MPHLERAPSQMFPCEFFEIFQKTEQLQMAIQAVESFSV